MIDIKNTLNEFAQECSNSSYGLTAMFCLPIKFNRNGGEVQVNVAFFAAEMDKMDIDALNQSAPGFDVVYCKPMQANQLPDQKNAERLLVELSQELKAMHPNYDSAVLYDSNGMRVHTIDFPIP